MSISNNAQPCGLIGGFEKCEIVISPYQLSWPRKFRQHADAIAQTLGSTLLQIEHISSTSVPGLGAKPVVDILVVVAEPGDEFSYLPHSSEGWVLAAREGTVSGTSIECLERLRRMFIFIFTRWAV